ncbi:3-keto-5-aminohexanoate cleavage protein [Parapedobacter sp. 2B3]|uniref:3-keto-5-aminohexanoate cleavage protein n=1 Tax=Parapedobacter sp. 2B3 TaxID=3342381 RepID=UPI0035B64F8C
MNEKKVLICVAPVPHTGSVVPDGVNVPVHPDAIAEEVLACAEAGAGMVHLHVRDENGEQTADLGHFSRTIDRIRQSSDIVLQGSTGGVADLSLEDRCVSLNEPRVEVASLNMGSSNNGEGVYINTLPDIRFWAAKMKAGGIKPELEIFDLSMIGSVSKLRREGLVDEPLSYNFCLGFENSLADHIDYLFYLKSSLPVGSHWGVIHRGMSDFALLVAAAAMGASTLSVGYEYSFCHHAGQVANTNAELVRRLVEALASIDRSPMTPSEARKHLGLKLSRAIGNS